MNPRRWETSLPRLQVLPKRQCPPTRCQDRIFALPENREKVVECTLETNCIAVPETLETPLVAIIYQVRSPNLIAHPWTQTESEDQEMGDIARVHTPGRLRYCLAVQKARGYFQGRIDGAIRTSDGRSIPPSQPANSMSESERRIAEAKKNSVSR